MNPKTVQRLIREGIVHLKCVCQLYQLQLDNGRHFLHEHPASAASWDEKCIRRIMDLHPVGLVTADQCEYGLTTPSQEDPSVMAPAKKPTKFMSSSPHMLKQLSKRCSGGHTHQHLVGGRSANAAFYPLPLVTAILRGIRDTYDAECVEVDTEATALAQVAMVATPMCGSFNSDYFKSTTQHADLCNWDRCPEFTISDEILSALPTEFLVALSKEDVLRKNKSAKSWIPMKADQTKGFHVNFKDECFKSQYLDEYTREVLPQHLVKEAMIDELSYWNSQVWQATPLKAAKTEEDAKIVRTRWVLCNKGDDAQPDVRARLVACEVNHGEESGGQFFASTPPLEGKRMLFSDFATRQT